MDELLVTSGSILVVSGLVLYVLGPPGLVVVGLVLLTASLWSPSDSAGEPTENCPDCGAVVDGETCDYCGRSLAESR